MTAELDEVLFLAVGALDAAGVPYAVAGGLAVNAWATPRATKDVDLYADLSPRLRPAVRKELEQRGFDVPDMDGELERFGVCRCRSSSGVFLDLFDVAGPLGEAILAHRASVAVAGREVSLVRREELAVLKAFSDRTKDFDDLVKLLRVGLDVPYLEEWARRLDESIGGNEVTERLQAAMRRAGPA